MIEDAPPSFAPVRGPLAGIRVLDVGNMFAAPFAGALLADLGADVIKIEAPGSGDSLRSMQPIVRGEPLLWALLDRNKRSLTLDLRREEGRDILLKLAGEHDVLLENFRPGTLDRWDLGIASLRTASPKLIVTRISGYGQTGPYSSHAGFGTPATAFSGYVYSNGFSDRPPVLPPFSLVDYLAGLFAAFGTVAALYYRERPGGVPQEVDVALYESMLRLLEGIITKYDQLGQVQEPLGDQFEQAVPAGIFRCADDVWMVLSTSTDRTFNRLATLMGRPDLSDDPQFSSNGARVQNREAVNSLVADWFAANGSADLQKVCDDAGVPVSKVNTMADVFADPHVRHRQSLVKIEHPTLGTLTLPGVVPKFSVVPGAVRTAGPALGEHTNEILAALGISLDEVERLSRIGVI